MGKPILCLDFDGVIHSYTSGWQGAGVANDPPVPGTMEYLIEATKHYRVMLYSSRSKSLAGRRAMRRYLREHFNMPLTFSPDHDVDWLPEAIGLPWFKPPALLTIDDRALTFTGDWSDFTPDKLRAFQPWNKRKADHANPHSTSGAGAWTVIEDRLGYREIIAADGDLVAEVYAEGHDRAHLIAAAPALYEALAFAVEVSRITAQFQPLNRADELIVESAKRIVERGGAALRLAQGGANG